MTKNIYFASDFHLGSPNHAESRIREDRIHRLVDLVVPHLRLNKLLALLKAGFAPLQDGVIAGARLSGIWFWKRRQVEIRQAGHLLCEMCMMLGGRSLAFTLLYLTRPEPVL